MAIALAGCGDGEESDGPGTTTPDAGGAGPSKAAYIADADQICRDALRQTRQIGRRFRAGGGVTDVGDPLELTAVGLFEPDLAVRQRQARRLRRLKPPPEDRATLSIYLDLFGPIEELIRQRVRGGGREATARQLEALIAGLATEQAEAARRYGLRVCDADFVAVAFPQPGGP